MYADFQPKILRFEKVIAESALAIVRFLGFGGGGARMSFNISIKSKDKFLYLVLYCRHLMGLQNSRKIIEIRCLEIAQFPMK